MLIYFSLKLELNPKAIHKSTLAFHTVLKFSQFTSTNNKYLFSLVKKAESQVLNLNMTSEQSSFAY